MAYGGTQPGNARLVIDDNGNQQVVYDDVEVSPSSRHQSVGAAFGRTAGQIMDPRKSLLPYILPYAAWAGATGAGAGTAASQGGLSNFVGMGGPVSPVGAASSAAVPSLGVSTPLLAANGLPIGLNAGLGTTLAAPSIAAPAVGFGAKAMANPFVKSMAGSFGEALPSLVMSKFMGPSKEEKAQMGANRALTEAQAKKLQQEAMFREWMRPMLMQAMQGMIGRLPTHLQGNLPQNMPQLPSMNPQPRSGQGSIFAQMRPRM